uniref:Uncharacterized protein n=1 Tax=Avena sativa TaxID=4498 RepID=A0ACD5XYZ2_AVESA
MPAGDNPHSISEKKAALRESPKQSKNAVVNQQARASLFPKHKAAETIGIKRPQPNGPLSPTNHHGPGNPGPNGHLVYVRRKIESDQSKGGASAGTESATSLSSKKPVIGGPQEQSLKHQNSVPNTQPAPAPASTAAPASVPGLHSASLPAHLSFAKQSPGKVPAHPSVVPTASPPQRNVVPTAMPQNFTAANTASPPQRTVSSTPVRQNFTVSNTASPPQRNVVSTAMPQNFTAANTASPPQRNVLSTAVPQNFTAANTASPTHCNVVSTAVPQNFTAANMAPCNVAATSTSTASRDAVATTIARSPADLKRSSTQDWKQRFIRLQAFLRNNEQSGQEEYIRMLQSLSSVGRSKHAIELEKRAVNLLIEEGKELQKMKSLNVLGKLPPTDHPTLPTQPTFAMRLPFQPFPARR